MDEQTRFEEEAARIYALLYGRSCPEVLVLRYREAAQRLQQRFPPAEIEAQNRILDRCGDWEALEMAARYRKVLAILVDKFRVMVSLSETLPDSYVCLINTRTRRGTAWLSLTFNAFRSVWKLMKGLFLLHRHREVLFHV